MELGVEGVSQEQPLQFNAGEPFDNLAVPSATLLSTDCGEIPD